MNDGANPGVPVQHQSSALLAGARFKEGCPKVKTLLAKMNKDGIHIVCKNDTLICSFGSFLMDPGEGVNEQYVSQKMRQLGRLLQSLRKLKKKENARLAHFFDPTNFDELVKATREMCYGEKVQQNKPSLALKIDHSIKDCIGILIGQSLRQGDTVRAGKLKDFKSLYEIEWSRKIARGALQKLETTQRNRVTTLPLGEDLASEAERISAEGNKYIWDCCQKRQILSPRGMDKARKGDIGATYSIKEDLVKPVRCWSTIMRGDPGSGHHPMSRNR